MEEILKLTCWLLYSQMPFLFMEFGASLQSVLQNFLQLHHLKKGGLGGGGRGGQGGEKKRKKKKKGKEVEKTVILTDIFQYIHFCVSGNYSSQNVGPEQKEKGNIFVSCSLNDSQTLVYMNSSTLA